eukprot:5567848-Amphidinium_carterae.1
MLKCTWSEDVQMMASCSCNLGNSLNSAASQVLFTIIIMTIAEEGRTDLDEDAMQSILLWRLCRGR